MHYVMVEIQSRSLPQWHLTVLSDPCLSGVLLCCQIPASVVHAVRSPSQWRVLSDPCLMCLRVLSDPCLTGVSLCCCSAPQLLQRVRDLTGRVSRSGFFSIQCCDLTKPLYKLLLCLGYLLLVIEN